MVEGGASGKKSKICSDLICSDLIKKDLGMCDKKRFADVFVLALAAERPEHKHAAGGTSCPAPARRSLPASRIRRTSR